MDTTTLLGELDDEAKATRRLLERVPLDRLDWAPHERSMTLGQLALHVAQVPGTFAGILSGDAVDFATVDFGAPAEGDPRNVLKILDESVGGARRWLAGLDEAEARAPYRARVGPVDLFTVPRHVLVRSLMFNHWYHHRGQLTVYLRLLGVPLPPLYGPTADENPFGPPPSAS